MIRVALVLLSVSLASFACSCRTQEAPKATKQEAPKTTAPAKIAKPMHVISAPPAADKSTRHWEVTVAAGAQDREAQVVTVSLPRNPPLQAVTVREANGAKVVAQMQGPNVVAFRSKPLKAGAEVNYLVDEDEHPAKPDKSGMQAVQNGDGIKLSWNGRPVVGYVSRPQTARKDFPPAAARGGYLHPLYSPAGVLVTDDSPKDQPFQHGIWTTWQKVETAGSRPDFWDLTKAKGGAAVESIGTVWGGPLAAGFDARQFFTDFDQHKGTTVLREAWDVRALRGSERATLVDVSSSLQAVNGDVTLGTNPFGGIMVRGNRDWQGDKAIFLTSEGADRGKGLGLARALVLPGRQERRQAGGHRHPVPSPELENARGGVHRSRGPGDGLRPHGQESADRPPRTTRSLSSIAMWPSTARRTASSSTSCGPISPRRRKRRPAFAASEERLDPSSRVRAIPDRNWISAGDPS